MKNKTCIPCAEYPKDTHTCKFSLSVGRIFNSDIYFTTIPDTIECVFCFQASDGQIDGHIHCLILNENAYFAEVIKIDSGLCEPRLRWLSPVHSGAPPGIP